MCLGPKIPIEVLNEFNARMLKRCKLYDPAKGKEWAMNNSGDRAFRLIWINEYNLCHRDASWFLIFRGDPNNVEELINWAYPSWLRGLKKRLGDVEAEKYEKMPFREQ